MSDTLQAPERLTDKLAGLLMQRIESGELAPNERLPTEQKLSEQFGVSRTVVREAVSRLKSIGLLTSRQGAGVFVSPRHQARALAFDPLVVTSMESVLQVVEVRRGLEADVAALPMFVAVRQFWLLGEYAGRVPVWGSQAMPLDYLQRQVKVLTQWETLALAVPPGAC